MAHFDRIVDCRELIKTKLWRGSMEELEFRYGGVRESHVRAKIAKLEACDDRTADEDEYLNALKRTL